MKATLNFRWIIILLLAAILVACSAAQPQTPPTGSIQVPVTGTTALPSPATTAPAADMPVTKITSAPSTSGIKFVLVPSKSTASYTVREQLAKFSFPTDAVGTTNSISGSITILPDGTIDSTNSKFTVDISTLKTDATMRDNFVRRAVVHTAHYPLAVFVPTPVSGRPATLPQSGDVA